MEKQTLNNDSNEDQENAAFLNTSYLKDSETTRRRNYVYLTLFNLFIFTLSMLSLICAVMSQKDSSGHSAAKLMDQFDIFSPAMHEVEYSHVKYALPNPLNSSKYVGLTDEVENAWMDIAYRTYHSSPHIRLINLHHSSA
jgi:ABC-type transport system involved in multi-copper enzyme maturation permease subunit